MSQDVDYSDITACHAVTSSWSWTTACLISQKVEFFSCQMKLLGRPTYDCVKNISCRLFGKISPNLDKPVGKCPMQQYSKFCTTHKCCIEIDTKKIESKLFFWYLLTYTIKIACGIMKWTFNDRIADKEINNSIFERFYFTSQPFSKP